MGEARVRCGLRHPGCVTTSWGYGEKSEERDAWRLPLIGYVGVITRRGKLVLETLHPVLVVWAKVDIVEFEVVLYVCTDGLQRVSLLYGS